MQQLELFEIEAPQPEFKHRSRGHVETNRVFKELDVHAKINIKHHYYGYPNYMIIDSCFENGLDTSVFGCINPKQVCYLKAGIRKILPK